jgi:hypothetical protein
MGLIELLVIVVVLALVFWLVRAYLLPLLPAPFGTIVLVILVIVAILLLLGLIGIGPGIRL